MAGQFGITNLTFGQLLFGKAAGAALDTFTTAKILSFADETNGLGDTVADVVTKQLGNCTVANDTTNKGTITVTEAGLYEIEARIDLKSAATVVNIITLHLYAGASFAALAAFANTNAGFWTPPQFAQVIGGNDATDERVALRIKTVVQLPINTVVAAYIEQSVSKAVTVYGASLSVRQIG